MAGTDSLTRSSGEAPLVSVVIPSYNYGHFIAQTIESVQGQTYKAWEAIVVDDGSTDDTGSIVAAMAENDRRIKYVKQANQGLAGARNTGIQHSRGEYLQFLDADDLLEPQKLERQVSFLQQHAEVDLVFSDARYFRSECPTERRFSQTEDNLPWVKNVSGNGDDVLVRLVAHNIMPVNAPLLRRSVVEDVGRFEPVVRGIEDWDYWLRCAMARKTFHYDDADGTRALVRFHSTSMSADARLMLRSTLLLHNRLCDLPLNPTVRRLNSRRMSETEGWLGIEEVLAGNLILGLRLMCKAALTDRVLRHKVKWLICAASAPFVSGDRLKGMVSAPLGSIKGVHPSQA